MLTGGLLQLLDKLMGKAVGSGTYNQATDSNEALAEAIAAIASLSRCEFENVATGAHTGDAIYHTLINLTGSGILYSLAGYVSANNWQPRITIDGEVLTATFANAALQGIQGGCHGTDLRLSPNANEIPAINWEYQDSLKIEYKLSDGDDTMYMTVNYGHD